MEYVTLPDRPTVSYDKYGSGLPLVLVHGSFSDHIINWAFVKPFFEQQFTVYAIARRGRGETDATEGHSLEDESLDVVTLIEAIGEPVFLLGHSYGAQVALAAAARVPDQVRKLVLYEAPYPYTVTQAALARLGENGWEAVEKEIDQAFQQHDELMIESLGAGSGFNNLHASLRGKYIVKLIKVSTNLAECLRRVKNRDNSNHIPISDDKVEEYNKIAASVHHSWDAILDNDTFATDEEILKVVESLRSS